MKPHARLSRLASTLTPFVGLLFALATPAAVTAAEPTVLKLATLAPTSSVWDKELRTMADDVRKRTDGRVVIRIYPGGVSGDDADIVRKLRLGQLQAASLTVQGLLELDRGFALFTVPRFFRSFPELFAVTHRLTPSFEERLAARGVVFLGWTEGGWSYLFSRRPVNGPGDLKGMKVFVWEGDNTMVQMWNDGGFHPVPLASAEVTSSLATGMIDALPTPALVALTLQWYRQAPYMLDIGVAPFIGGTVVSKQSWDRLAPADQAVVRELALRMQTRLEELVPQQDRQALDEMARRGLHITHARDAQQEQEWDATATRFADFVRSRAVPTEVFDIAQRLRLEVRREGR